MTNIRRATDADLAGLYRIAEDMGAVNERNYFERCLAEQEEGKRVLLVAEEGGRLTGYAQLVWKPLYAAFRRLGIPEIQDLNVIPDARQKGLGGRLVEACEELVRAAGKPEVGISVGVCHSYGAAQRLYIKKGYIPDGAGICYDDVPVRSGELWSTIWRGAALDSLVTLKLVKTINMEN
jgi:GNAT superfamily N-acetyltransferase